ncbi:MAG: hypothetical protein QOJ80_6328 [Mycobacterium sp.]|jgi:hypothetical protein|nr:hypothetical protein [Mycobacterium sp.]
MAKPSTVAAAAKRHGFDVIEAASLESLRRESRTPSTKCRPVRYFGQW